MRSPHRVSLKMPPAGKTLPHLLGTQGPDPTAAARAGGRAGDSPGSLPFLTRAG